MAIIIVCGLAAVSASPPSIEAAIFTLMTAVGFIVTRHYRPYLELLFCVLTVVLASLIIYGSQKAVADGFYAAGELKWLFIFAIWPMFYGILVNGRAVGNGYKDLPASIYKTYILALITMSLIGLALGHRRDTIAFGFSINAAYSIIYLYLAFFRRTSLRWTLLSIVSLGLLGSTFATFVFLIVAAYRVRASIVSKVTFGAIGLVAFYFYAIWFRHKDFLNTDFQDVDRLQILQFYSMLVSQNFHPINYIFGWGVGREIIATTTHTGKLVIDYWFIPTFSHGHVYSYGTHNELLRVFIDFGLIGAAIVYLALQRLVPWTCLLMILVLGLTNTTIFAASNIYVLALIIGFSVFTKRARVPLDQTYDTI